MNGLLLQTMYKSLLIALVYTCAMTVHQAIGQNEGKEQPRNSDECQVTPVIHVLQYPGCVPKPIPSFACIGRCSSYLQVIVQSRFSFFGMIEDIFMTYVFTSNYKVSGSKIWQMERSCMCCQESGEREAAVSLFCPKAKPGERKFRKVWRLNSTVKTKLILIS